MGSGASCAWPRDAGFLLSTINLKPQTLTVLERFSTARLQAGLFTYPPSHKHAG